MTRCQNFIVNVNVRSVHHQLQAPDEPNEQPAIALKEQ